MNGWSGIVVGRIQPPVPYYSCEGDFHYAHPDAISSGEITEKFGLKTEHVVDASARKQDELVSSCGNPELELKYKKSDESVFVHASITDANDTFAKMLASVDGFVFKYTGDLRNAVPNELKRCYNAKKRQMQVPEQSKRQKHMMILTGKSSLEQMNWKTCMCPSLISI